jgi:TRAP transporter 4TM/12TM fusion protein
MKLGLRGMPRADIPHLRRTFFSGVHFLIPIAILIYLLMVERWTASSSVFYSIISMMVILVAQHVVAAWRGGEVPVADAAMTGLVEIYSGLVAGARNMVSIAVAVAAAGIIVGAVASTGLNNALVGVVEAISGGNVYILLGLTAVLCLILGMGLPTTANYLVVATLLAGVLVELGTAAGLVLPLIAVHLFVFYFGILADDTPPVCLAAFAAAAISRADPIKTGIQGFTYDIRTAILPFVFIFNPELLLIGITSVWHGILIFVVSLIAILCFSSATQGWLIIKTRLYESVLLLVVSFALFRPDFVMNQFYPQFATLDLEKFVAGEAVAPAGYSVRFHVVRSTDYGDRFKLYRVATPDMVAAGPEELYGVMIEATEDRGYEVADLAPTGLAEQVGIEIGDTVTEVDVEQVGQPSRRWVYPFALALLGLIAGMQWMRRRRTLGEEVAAPASND